MKHNKSLIHYIAAGSCMALAATVCLSATARKAPAQADYIIAPEQKLRLAERIIETYYVDTLDIDKTVEAGIISMLKTLDPHSTYSDAKETRELTEPLDGEFSGVGIQFNMLNDTLFVVNPIVGGPSEKVGIVAGDRIIWADDSLMSGAGKSTSDVRRILRGPKGTPVKMRIKRRNNKELIDFRVVRDEIPIYSVDAGYMAAPEVGYIRITRFAESTPGEVAKALATLSKAGMKKLIIDLESNGGGYMHAATELMKMFLSKGAGIVYTKGLRSPETHIHADGTGRYHDVDVVVLVDQNSASASEIVAGAFQDNDRGVVVGRRTFGKGLVQRPFPFPDGSMIRLTTSRYYTPSGRSIQKPYDKGEDDYRLDIYRRMKSGELTADSISTSHDGMEVYHTVGGREVYGGGGITPDVNVPLDTTFFTDYYRDLLAKGVINRFVLDYLDRNRTTLLASYPTEELFIERFEVSPAILSDMRRMAEADSIPYDSIQQELSHERLVANLKGLIGRNLYNDTTFYKILNPLNPSFRRALDLLNDRKAYQSILR